MGDNRKDYWLTLRKKLSELKKLNEENGSDISTDVDIEALEGQVDVWYKYGWSNIDIIEFEIDELCEKLGITKFKSLAKIDYEGVEQEIKEENRRWIDEETTGPNLNQIKNKAKQKLDEIERIFPEELKSLLDFGEKNGFITIKPRQFLGSENFVKIAHIMRGLGGVYISAGKDSHFRV